VPRSCYTIGGRLKDSIKVKPITLPRLKCLDDEENPE
jgi:hypothetical protein